MSMLAIVNPVTPCTMLQITQNPDESDCANLKQSIGLKMLPPLCNIKISSMLPLPKLSLNPLCNLI